MRVPLLINTCDKYLHLVPLAIESLKACAIDEAVSTIYVNNEAAPEAIEGCTLISSIRGERSFPVKQWSDHLRTALECIDSDFILITQDDYYFKAFSSQGYRRALDLILKDQEIGCVHLSSHVAARGGWRIEGFKELVGGRYQLNSQFALWRKSFLIDCLPPETNPWMWELTGHRRVFLSKRIVALSGNEDLSEYFALIKKGKLLREASSVLQANEFRRLMEIHGVYVGSRFERLKTLISALVG